MNNKLKVDGRILIPFFPAIFASALSNVIGWILDETVLMLWCVGLGIIE